MSVYPRTRQDPVVETIHDRRVTDLDGRIENIAFDDRDLVPDARFGDGGPGRFHEVRINFDADTARAKALGGRDEDAAIAAAEIQNPLVRAQIEELQ